MGSINSCCGKTENYPKTRNELPRAKSVYGYHSAEYLDFVKFKSDNWSSPSEAVDGLRLSVRKVCLSDFTILKVLGKGSFGKVLQVEKNDTGKIYAMKIMEKDVIEKKGQKFHTKTEREILGQMDSPFVLDLHYAFQTDDKLYLVMDFMSGGELFFHLRKERKFFESKAKFYAAEIILALEYLHSKGIIYRDLKPENILINADGHIKVADFGLSKLGITDGQKTYTFCGTPEYLAPEILQGRGYDKAVDFWSLGALIYEMLTGGAPFYSKDKHKMYRNILEKPLEMKSYFSAEAASLLSSLMVVQPSKRLSNIDELKQHEFFRGLDWNELLHRRINPPFIPKITDEKDLKYFDKMFTDETPHETPQTDDVNKVVSENLSYKGFTYDPDSTKGLDHQFVEHESIEDSGFVDNEIKVTA